VLRAPGYLGVYPVEIRARGVLHETDAVVEVIPHGFVNRPGFFTHRDPDLNRLLRVRFTQLRPWPQLHLRAGSRQIFLSVARLRSGGLWRLLEATAAP
jgi:hypothetical protein